MDDQRTTDGDLGGTKTYKTIFKRKSRTSQKRSFFITAQGNVASLGCQIPLERQSKLGDVSPSHMLDYTAHTPSTRLYIALHSEMRLTNKSPTSAVQPITCARIPISCIMHPHACLTSHALVSSSHVLDQTVKNQTHALFTHRILTFVHTHLSNICKCLTNDYTHMCLTRQRTQGENTQTSHPHLSNQAIARTRQGE